MLKTTDWIFADDYTPCWKVVCCGARMFGAIDLAEFVRKQRAIREQWNEREAQKEQQR